MIHDAIQQMAQMLRNLRAFLEAGSSLAVDGKFDVGNLLGARLAPDMYNLIRQVQTASDTAKFAVARLSGSEAPRYEDTETTLDELLARIDKTIEYISSFAVAVFDGAEARRVTLPFRPGHDIAGATYFLQFAQPNFYFHVSMAYAILRHNGVGLGKFAYIGRLDLEPLEESTT